MSTETKVSAREELARLITDGQGVWRTALESADAIIAAGWSIQSQAAGD